MDSVVASGPAHSKAEAQAAIQPKPTLDLVEFEMALDSAHSSGAGFLASVGKAAEALGGTLLFDLPASSLIADCQKIAAVQPSGEDGADIVFAVLSEDGCTIRVELPSQATAGLARFAQAYLALQTSLCPRAAGRN